MGAQAVRLSNMDIDNALRDRQFEILFQPIFDLSNGALARMESFVRWRHPTLGVLPPGAFISFFETQGRMTELTRYVLEKALQAYLDWRGPYAPGFSINLALSDLTDEAFADHLKTVLKNSNFPAEYVTLECPMPPVDFDHDLARDRFAALSATGARLAIEVRGRANELLKSLSPFPFAEVKSGGAAILRFARTVRGPGLSAISELVELSNHHNAAITAVGVEDQSSLTALKGLGFAAAQGNFLGKVGALEKFTPTRVNDVRVQLGMAPLNQTDIDALFRTTASGIAAFGDQAPGKAGVTADPSSPKSPPKTAAENDAPEKSDSARKPAGEASTTRARKTVRKSAATRATSEKAPTTGTKTGLKTGTKSVAGRRRKAAGATTTTTDANVSARPNAERAGPNAEKTSASRARTQRTVGNPDAKTKAAAIARARKKALASEPAPPPTGSAMAADKTETPDNTPDPTQPELTASDDGLSPDAGSAQFLQQRLTQEYEALSGEDNSAQEPASDPAPIMANTEENTEMSAAADDGPTSQNEQTTDEPTQASREDQSSTVTAEPKTDLSASEPEDGTATPPVKVKADEEPDEKSADAIAIVDNAAPDDHDPDDEFSARAVTPHHVDEHSVTTVDEDDDPSAAESVDDLAASLLDDHVLDPPAKGNPGVTVNDTDSATTAEIKEQPTNAAAVSEEDIGGVGGGVEGGVESGVESGANIEGADSESSDDATIDEELNAVADTAEADDASPDHETASASDDSTPDESNPEHAPESALESQSQPATESGMELPATPQSDPSEAPIADVAASAGDGIAAAAMDASAPDQTLDETLDPTSDPMSGQTVEPTSDPVSGSVPAPESGSALDVAPVVTSRVLAPIEEPFRRARLIVGAVSAHFRPAIRVGQAVPRADVSDVSPATPIALDPAMAAFAPITQSPFQEANQDAKVADAENMQADDHASKSMAEPESAPGVTPEPASPTTLATTAPATMVEDQGDSDTSSSTVIDSVLADIDGAYADEMDQPDAQAHDAAGNGPDDEAKPDSTTTPVAPPLTAADTGDHDDGDGVEDGEIFADDNAIPDQPTRRRKSFLSRKVRWTRHLTRWPSHFWPRAFRQAWAGQRARNADQDESHSDAA